MPVNGGKPFQTLQVTITDECSSAPGDNSRTKDRLKYYVDLAKLAEKHKTLASSLRILMPDMRFMMVIWMQC